MPKAKRERRERTDNWELIQQWCRMPEQRLYESIRPITLFGLPPAERAQETGLAESTLRRTADAFDALGIARYRRMAPSTALTRLCSAPFSQASNELCAASLAQRRIG
jgi:hypothetical protein